MTPSLATVPGKLLTMLFVTHHSDTLAPKQRHLLEPAHLVQLRIPAKLNSHSGQREHPDP